MRSKIRRIEVRRKKRRWKMKKINIMTNEADDDDSAIIVFSTHL